MIENLRQLSFALRTLTGEEVFYVPQAGLRTFWPNPDIYKDDDHLEPAERAEKWCKQYDCTVQEMVDPPGLRFVKVSRLPENYQKMREFALHAGRGIDVRPEQDAFTRTHCEQCGARSAQDCADGGQCEHFGGSRA